MATTLVVKAIDLSQPGSYGERRRFLRLLRRLQAMNGAQDAEAVLATLDEADELLRGRLATDDGTPVEEVLDRISANDFDRLLSAIAFEGGGVGNASRLPSTAGPEGSPEPSTRSG